MNNDLISRKALKKAIEQYQIQWNKNEETYIAHWDCCESILAIIENATTVEPEQKVPPELLNQLVEIIRDILPQVVEIAKIESKKKSRQPLNSLSNPERYEELLERYKEGSDE